MILSVTESVCVWNPVLLAHYRGEQMNMKPMSVELTRTRKSTRKTVMNRSANADDVSQTAMAISIPGTLGPT